jgi:aryl-alcohol dehydrogenase-like predicted oxidoreductase
MFFKKKKIIIGTANFGFKYGFKNNQTIINSQEVLKIRELCNTYGIDKIDTSMDYGSSEKIIGQTLNGYDVTTKIQYLSGTQNQIKDEIIFSVNRSLLRLKTNKLHCLMLHDPLQLTSSNGKFIFKVSPFNF